MCRKIALILFGLLVAGFILLLLGTMMWYAQRPSKESMEQLVQEELPIGSSRQEVEALLERNNISHSWAEYDQAVYASIRNTGIAFPYKEGIFMRFYMDDELKLKEVEIWYAYYP
jgi:hypothetical protein